MEEEQAKTIREAVEAVSRILFPDAKIVVNVVVLGPGSSVNLPRKEEPCGT